MWSKKDVHVNTDATLELVDPLTIGKPNLYRLSIRLKIDYIKIGAQEFGWYISDREVGSIMLAVEEAKAFFGRKQKLYYIKTNGHWDIPEKDKNKKPLRRLHKQEQPDWFTRIGEYLIGFHPMIGPLYSTWQFLNHFKGGKLAPTWVFTTKVPGVYKDGLEETWRKALPVFSDHKTYDVQVMNWDKFLEKDPGTTECGHVWGIYYFFELFREKPDETFLYIRVLVPQLVRRLGTGAKLSFWHGWIELEWAVKLPALTKVRPERERYQLITWWTTWGNAKIDCEKRGGHLVTIDSDDENEIVTELLTDSGYPHAWIGLSDNGKGKTNRKWEWVTTTNMKSMFYRKWGKNQPDALKEYYVDIRSDGTWNDWCQDPSNTDYKMPYICEFELMKPEGDPELAKRKEVVTEPEDPEGKHSTVVIWVTPEEVRVGETFTVYLKAKDDVGLQSMWWWGKNTGIPELDKDHTARIFGTYAASHWPITATEAGRFTLMADARDREGHQASDGKGIAEATITVTDGEATAKLKFSGAFDNDRKTDLSKYRVSIRLNGEKVFSGTPPNIKHAGIRKFKNGTKTIWNFKSFEIIFDKSLLKKGRNKLEVSLSGVDRNHWFCWDSFSIGGTGVKSWSYHPATKYDDTSAPLGILEYRVSGHLWPSSPAGADGVYGGDSTTVFSPIKSKGRF